MAFQAVPNTATFKVRHDGAGENAGSYAEWSLEVTKSSDWSDANVLTMATAIDAWVSSDYLALLSTGWVVRDVQGTNLEFEGAAPQIVSTNAAGTRAGNAAPPSVAVYIRLFGTTGFPPKRGGMFWPVGTETDLEGALWDTTFLASVATAYDALDTDVNAALAGADVVIVSRYASTNDDVKNARAALRAAIAATRRATGLVSSVSNRVPRTEIASQRDRRPSD